MFFVLDTSTLSVEYNIHTPNITLYAKDKSTLMIDAHLTALKIREASADCVFFYISLKY